MANEFRVKNGLIVGGDILPSADGSFDLGASGTEFQDGWFDGTVNCDDLTVSGTSTTIGTVTSGTWTGTAISPTYGGTGLVGANAGTIVIADGSGAPTTLDVGSSTAITILGTVATGTWEGTTIAVNQGGTGVTSMTNLKNALDDETWTFANKITADAGIDIDNFNIDGVTIALSSGNMVIDSAGDINLDAANSDINFKVDGTHIGALTKSASNNDFVVRSVTSDSDLLFKGSDGGVGITALTLDMSEAGAATFGGGIADAGTISAGTWQGTAIASAYLDSDTAHLSGTQTFSGTKTFSSTLLVAGEIQHSGDTNNSIAFGTDTQTYETGGTTRLDISDSGVRLGGANSRVTTILGENNMASDSATALATQQSIKAYVDDSVGSAGGGDITAVTAGVGLSGGGTTGGVTLTLDMSELTDMTADVTDNVDEFIILDGGADRRKMMNEIDVGGFRDVITGPFHFETDQENVALGEGALDSLTQYVSGIVPDGGSQNTAIGESAGTAVSTGDANVLVGHDSGKAITSGLRNIMIGSTAGDGFDAENDNIGIGYAALGGSVAGGEFNVGIGTSSLVALTSGDSNTAVGHESAQTIQGGSNNVIIGADSEPSAAGATNQIVIGKGAVGLADNSVVLGNTDITAWLPPDDAGVDLGSSSYQFKDAYIHGTLEADAITIGGTNVVSGSLITTLGTISAGTWQGTAIAQSYIADQAINEAKLHVSNAPTNGYVLTAQSGNTGGLTWAAASSGGGISNVVEDTSPQLGGDLDTNSQNIKFDNAHGIYDDSGNEMLIFGKTTSATSYIKLWNSIADSTSGTLFGTDVVGSDTAGGGRMTGPGIEATGSETDIGLAFKTKGLGHFMFVNDDTTSAAAPVLNLARKHSSEADNDVIGAVLFTAMDSSPAGSDVEDLRTYAKIKCTTVDVSDSSADGQMILSALVADSHTDLMRVGVHEDDDNAAGVALYRGMMIDHGSSHTLTEADEAGCYVRATAAITLTLPASPAKGEQYVVISDHAGTTTISANGSDTMNGSTTNQTITTRYEAKTFIAVSTSAWIVIG